MQSYLELQANMGRKSDILSSFYSMRDTWSYDDKFYTKQSGAVHWLFFVDHHY